MWYLYFVYRRTFHYLKVRARYEGFELEYSKEESAHGSVDPKTRLITLNNKLLSTEEQIFILAHELGHILDLKHNGEDWTKSEILDLKVYREGLVSGLPSLTKDKLVAKEQAAWDIAEQILSKTEKFNWLRSRFLKIRDKSLDTYLSIQVL